MRRSPTQCYEWLGYIEVASPVLGPHHSSGFTSFEARAARVFFCPASWDAVWIRSELYVHAVNLRGLPKAGD
jgi:hypothetical protein